MCVFFSALTVSIGELQGSDAGALHALRLQRNVVLQQGVLLQQVLHLQQVLPKVGRQEPSLETRKKKKSRAMSPALDGSSEVPPPVRSLPSCRPSS